MSDNSLLIILGNQLFPIEELKKIDCQKIFIKEDLGLCTDYKPVSYTNLRANETKANIVCRLML